MTGPIVWRANPGPQTEFLASSADEVLYGGAAGGGKSDALLIAPLRWVNHPRSNALILRPTYDEIEKVLVPRSYRYFKAIAPDAEYSQRQHLWTFPSGGRIGFGYMGADDDAYRYQGDEFTYLGWDELTHFSEFQYRYLKSRLRSSSGVPIRERSGSNPGNIGHEWVQKHWGPWLAGPEWEGPRAKPGEKLRFINPPTCKCFAHGPEDEEERYVGPDFLPRCEHDRIFTRTFIPARMEDNPYLDPAYRASIAALPLVQREQLANGNWLIKVSAGLYFKRGWWQFCDRAPDGIDRWVRRWDFAATEDSGTNDPDFTVSAKGGAIPALDAEGNEIPAFGIYVTDATAARLSPNAVEQLVLETAEQDGPEVEIIIPEDPGQAGKAQVAHYKRLLVGYTVRGARETGSKVVRAGPYSSQVEAGNVHLVRGPWNERWIQIHEAFPTPGIHDDEVDVGSGLFSALTGKVDWFDVI